MNYRKITLALVVLFSLVTARSVAQTRGTGREEARGEINFSSLATYYRLHPEPLAVRRPDNDDDDNAPRSARSISDPSLIRTRSSSTHTAMLPVGGGAFLPVSPGPVDSFESTLDNNTVIPPDTHGAVDSQYCMTAINSSVTIQTRTGTTVSTVSLDGFFSGIVSTGEVYDPRIHYDAHAGRWIFVADYGPQATTSSLLIAISKTGDPTGAWYEFKVLVDATGTNWLDFPQVGFNGKWITVSGNMFTVAASAYTEAKFFVFNKANLLAGTSATYTSFTQASSFTMCPTLTYDTSEQSMFFIEDWNASAGNLRLSKVTGPVGSETWAVVGYPTTTQLWQEESNQNSGTGGADFAPQVGVTNKIQLNDDRFTQAICMNGHLWFAHTIFLPYSTTANATRTSIQWWETDTLGNPVQLGAIDDPANGNFYAFPSLAVNVNNDVCIGFAAFSASTHPSAAYALRLHTDPTDSIRPLLVFRHGLNSYYKTYSGTRNRWGDYSGTVIDPLNPTNFWTIQEASAATVNTWDTWWAQIQLCSPPAAITGTTGICIGATTTLNDVTTGGTWTSSNTSTAIVSSASGMVTGVASGTVTITYASGAGCSSTIIVTVNPPASAITGSVAVCSGATITLGDVTTGGVWSSGNTAVATIDDVLGVVYGIAPGTAAITYTPASSCPVMAVVTVNSLPSGVTGASIVCTGATITLSDATTGGVWSSDNAGVATVSAAGVVTGVTTGTADISYTVTNGCGTSSVSQTVSVSPAPSAGSITGAASTCVGTSIALADVTSAGVWSSSNSGIATVDGSGNVAGVSAGTATISYTVASSCGSAVAVSVVAINALPFAGTITGASTVCVAATAALSDASSGGAWSSSTAGIATVTPSGIITGVTPGTASISYTVTNGCGTAVASTTITVNALPVAGTVTGMAAICPGATDVLIDATSGGVWSSGSTSIATVNASGTVTGVSGGTANISYTVTGSCGTAIASGIVTVNAATSAGTIGGTKTVCVGATTALNDGITVGVWSSGNTGIATVNAAGVVTGLASGTAGISYTVTGTCGTAVTSGVVTVNAVPTVAAILGTATVCASATTALGDGTTGGVWSSSSTTIASVSTSAVVRGVAAGTANISYTVTNTCGASVAIQVVTVNTAPATAGTITGTATVCVSATTTLANITTGGTWHSSNSAIASVGSTGTVRGVAAGTATISYTVTNTCGSAVATKVVTVSAATSAGTISGTATVCVSASTTLSDATTGGVWSSSTTSKASISTAGVVRGVASGTSTISYTVTKTCGSAVATKIVTVSATPTAAAISGAATVAVAATITLTDATTGGVWSSSSTARATVSSAGVVHGVATGSATISYTVTNSCGSAHATKAITITAKGARETPSGTGEDNIPVSSLQIYPNPTSGTFTVNAPTTGVLHLVSIDGKELGRFEVQESISSFRIPDALAPGVYIYQFIDNNGAITSGRLVYRP